MIESWPSVSVLTPTYGRPALLEEAIESFLRQDYPGRTEMVVYNTLFSQTLSCDRIRVVNSTDRPPLGTIRNRLVEQAQFDLLVNLDDDDLLRPHYLTMCVETLLEHRLDWAQVGKMFYTRDRVIEVLNGPSGNQMIFTRAAWAKAGGYPALDTAEDAGFHKRLIEAGCRGGVIHKPISQTGHIFGWGSHGGSALHTSEGQVGASPLAAEQHVLGLVASGKTPSGPIELVPKWARDYESDCEDWLNLQPL